MERKLEPYKGGVSIVKKQIFRWALVILWLILTVYLSQQSGNESSATSSWLAHKLFRIFEMLGINVSYSAFHAVLRKIAHFGIHFVLAWLGYRALLISCDRRRNAIIVTLVLFGAIALFDEAIQSIAPGRAMMLFDATINLSGVILGTIIGILTTKQIK